MKKSIVALLIMLFCITESVWASNSNSVPDKNNTIYGTNKADIVLDMSELNAFEQNYQKGNIEVGSVSLSEVEKMYNGFEAIKTGKILRQIGYNIFNSETESKVTTTGKYDNDYRLSVGEKVSIYLYGDSVDVMAISGSNLLSPVVKTEVDSKGNIFVQGIGIVPAENRTIKEVEQSINQLASRKYRNLNIKLNVASGSNFSVFVYGQVVHPGKVLISNNSSLIDAIGAAGGMKKTGTLRKVVYTSNRNTKNIDLYDIILAGNDSNIILKPNDKIFVGAIGSVVGLKNGVMIPGIYEIKEGETLTKLVKYAGGLLPNTQVADVVISGLNVSTQQRESYNVSWEDAQNTKLKSGDAVEFKSLYNETENTVVLQGNVKHPATFVYKENMHLSDILKGPDELLEETFISQAVIRRVSGKNNTVETIPIFLKEFFAGTSDPVLKPRDVINIYKNTNAEFIDVYGCINMPKHITYTKGMKLINILTDIQFVEANTDDTEQDETDRPYNEVSNTLVLEGSTTKNEKIIPTDNVAVEIISKDGTTQLYYLYDILVNSELIKNIKLKPNDQIFFRQLRGNEMIKNVKVSGFVKHPGVFKFVSDKKLSDMIELAGGLTDEADLRGIVFKRKNIQTKQVQLAEKNLEKDVKLLQGRLASAYKATESDTQTRKDMISTLQTTRDDLSRDYNGQIALNIKNRDLSKISKVDNISVQDGDEIYIPRLLDNVIVIGEVYNEQSFVYKKGAKVKDYIKQVGGYTPNANKFRMYKVGINGKAEKVRRGTTVSQGDTIVVPRKIAGNDWLSPLCSSLQGVASILSTAFMITNWRR